jgi:FMNH2-dependent dimethyl sulfone monooxygenase
VAGAIGSRLERMRSMVAVHPGLWHPAMIAKLSMSLDRICKGGMAINLVTGASESEFQMFGGSTLMNTDGRYTRATEFVKFLKGSWENEIFSMPGEYYPTENFEMRLRPRNATPPEMFTAATSEGGRNMVAETGDWWFLPYDRNITTTDELLRELEKSIADMTQRMARYGRTVRFAFNPFVGFGADTHSAVEATITRIIAHEKNPDTSKIQRSMLPATLGGCMGRPEDIRRQLGRFSDMGIELLLFKMAAGIADIEQIGSEVIGPFRTRPE